MGMTLYYTYCMQLQLCAVIAAGITLTPTSLRDSGTPRTTVGYVVRYVLWYDWSRKHYAEYVH